MKNIKVRSIIIFFTLLLHSTNSFSQTWQIIGHRTDSTESENSSSFDRKLSNVQDLSVQLRKIIPDFQKNGYLAASIDSIAINGSKYEVYYFVGQQYRWTIISFDSISTALLIVASINKDQFTKKPLNPNTISNLSEKILSYCDENGFPFAKVWLSDFVALEPQKISATLRIERAELRKIDSIIIHGDVGIPQAFLMRYLNI